MTLLVCPLSQVETARALHRPSHLVSLLSPASPAEAWPVADGAETCAWPSTTSPNPAKA
jgi:predicted protein tyrosine phosphatase